MRTHRVAILVGLFVATVVGALFVDPIPQDPAFHLFADSRAWLGVSNFMDVISNAGFTVVGVAGLVTVLGRGGRAVFVETWHRLPHGVFFFGVAMVGAGSAYYHLAPNNDTLFWDRLPMTVAFMALFAAVIADRVHARVGVNGLLPVLIAAGVLSLLYWDWTESLDRGDLRFYALVQFFPIVALPVVCVLFPGARHTGGRYLIQVVGWYLLAKVLEHADAEVFGWFGGTVSGHTLKHLAATVATFVVLRMVVAGKTPRPVPVGGQA
jgi:hypothetical protein